MTNLPRIATMDFRLDAYKRSLSEMQSRIDRERQRRRLKEEQEQDEASTDLPAVASHRGMGSVMPAPSAPPKGAFTNALELRTSPPSSVTLTAAMAEDAPLWKDEAHETFDISTPSGFGITEHIKNLEVAYEETNKKANLTRDKLDGLVTMISAFALNCSTKFDEAEKASKD